MLEQLNSQWRVVLESCSNTQANVRSQPLEGARGVGGEELRGLVVLGQPRVAPRVADGQSHHVLVQTAAVAGCRYFFVVVRALDGAIAAHACIYLVDTDFLQLMPRWLQPAIQGLRRVWPRLFKARITECAAPLVTGSSISVRKRLKRASPHAVSAESPTLRPSNRTTRTTAAAPPRRRK